MTNILPACAGLLIAIVALTTQAAEPTPTVSQVYEEARAGHLDRAQEMMAQVLREHPNSAKAHYVMAELYAARGERALAAEQLRVARHLEPGLPFATEKSVRELERQLARPDIPRAPAGASPARFSLGWAILALLAGIGFVALLYRRGRAAPAPMPSAQSSIARAESDAPATATATAPGNGPGIGSAIASGVAAGAGIVAGEALASRLFGTQHPATPPPAEKANPPDANNPRSNDDFGGDNFGTSDPESWDDDHEQDGGDDSGGSDDWN